MFYLNVEAVNTHRDRPLVSQLSLSVSAALYCYCNSHLCDCYWDCDRYFFDYTLISQNNRLGNACSLPLIPHVTSNGIFSQHCCLYSFFCFCFSQYCMNFPQSNEHSPQIILLQCVFLLVEKWSSSSYGIVIFLMRVWSLLIELCVLGLSTLWKVGVFSVCQYCLPWPFQLLSTWHLQTRVLQQTERSFW